MVEYRPDMADALATSRVLILLFLGKQDPRYPLAVSFAEQAGARFIGLAGRGSATSVGTCRRLFASWTSSKSRRITVRRSRCRRRSGRDPGREGGSGRGGVEGQPAAWTFSKPRVNHATRCSGAVREALRDDERCARR